MTLAYLFLQLDSLSQSPNGPSISPLERYFRNRDIRRNNTVRGGKNGGGEISSQLGPHYMCTCVKFSQIFQTMNKLRDNK